MKIVIYGAQGIALGAYKAMTVLFPEQKVSCFLVSEMGKNATVLGGLPVKTLSEFVAGLSSKELKEICVVIATPETVMGEIEESLDKAGLCCYVCLDSVRWSKMQELAFEKTKEYMPLAAYSIGCVEPPICVYKMKHHKDKPLKTPYNDAEYVLPLQVGAANTDERVTRLTDNHGDNISDRNGNYSELTGLYWVWKNVIQEDKDKTNKYYGICHYRRVMELSRDDLLRLQDNEIDVLLPYPMPYEPNIEAHHKRYLSDVVWDAVLQALRELQPEYDGAFRTISRQEYLYNYNIIIAKGHVLEDYCNWLFPILQRIEEIKDPEKIMEPNRYIGYIGETLETLYFMYNRDRLKIAHVGCRFLV